MATHYYTILCHTCSFQRGRCHAPAWVCLSSKLSMGGPGLSGYAGLQGFTGGVAVWMNKRNLKAQALFRMRAGAARTGLAERLRVTTIETLGIAARYQGRYAHASRNQARSRVQAPVPVSS